MCMNIDAIHGAWLELRHNPYPQVSNFGRAIVAARAAALESFGSPALDRAAGVLIAGGYPDVSITNQPPGVVVGWDDEGVWSASSVDPIETQSEEKTRRSGEAAWMTAWWQRDDRRW